MSIDTARDRNQTAPGGPRRVQHDLLLAALPHPILTLADDERIVYAIRLRSSSSRGQATLKRHRLAELLAFGSPLIGLVDQVRRTGASVNEYGIEVVIPRLDGSKLVDAHGGPLPEQPSLIVLMLQQRTMAQMIERQLTHRPRRVGLGMAAMLAHEIKNPLAGKPRRRPAPRAGTRRRRPVAGAAHHARRGSHRNLVDRMECSGTSARWPKAPVNIHDVLDHVCQLASSGFARKRLNIIARYDPSLPPVPANRDMLVQAFLNLVMNALRQ